MTDHQAVADTLEEWWQEVGWQIRGIDHELPYKAIVDVVLAGLEQVGYCWPSASGVPGRLVVRDEPPWDPTQSAQPVFRLTAGVDRSSSGEQPPVPATPGNREGTGGTIEEGGQ